ncbi:MAG: MBL fold metallo-hydrolase [Patescibacteria group bacterium]|jgi:L-ascorbate metabolism protein UlaG (beta-lactamase superfamily)
MHLTWLGQACFKIQGKDVTIITDPFDQKIGLKLPRLQANIVTVSHDHYDHNNIEAVKGDPFVITQLGEYEIKKVFIRGISSWHDDKQGAERGRNIIYTFNFEDIKIVHLGDLGAKLDDEQLDKIEDVDILLIPVGGIYTLNGKQAAELVNEIEPRIVVPMHYKIPDLKEKLNSLDAFCNEMGVKNYNAEEKLKISKRDLPADETKVVVLKV